MEQHVAPAPAPVAVRRTRRRAVLLVLGAAAVFSVAAACVKALSGAIPLAQVVFCRNVLAAPVLLLLLLRDGGLRALRMHRPGLHAARLAAGLGGMYGALYGYAHLPLATVTALGFTMPLFLALLSAHLLAERVGAARGAAVLAGFLSVLLMTNPVAGGRPDLPTIAAVLGGAFAWALAMITIRLMGASGERNTAIML